MCVILSAIGGSRLVQEQIVCLCPAVGWPRPPSGGYRLPIG